MCMCHVKQRVCCGQQCAFVCPARSRDCKYVYRPLVSTQQGRWHVADPEGGVYLEAWHTTDLDWPNFSRSSVPRCGFTPTFTSRGVLDITLRAPVSQLAVKRVHGGGQGSRTARCVTRACTNLEHVTVMRSALVLVPLLLRWEMLLRRGDSPSGARSTVRGRNGRGMAALALGGQILLRGSRRSGRRGHRVGAARARREDGPPCVSGYQPRLSTQPLLPAVSPRGVAAASDGEEAT